MKPKGESFIPIEATFIDELSGMAMVKYLDLKTGGVNTIKMRVIMNIQFLDVMTKSSKYPIFYRNESSDVLKLRSIGYYRVVTSNIWSHTMNSDYYRHCVRSLIS